MRIFNQIRKGLLKSGRIKDYTKYAIGEIILVVIGILIALQINNWNEERKIHNDKDVVLKMLKESFLKNKESIISTLDEYQTSLRITELRIKNSGPKIAFINQSILDSIRLIDFINLKLANDLNSNILIDNSSIALLESDKRQLLLEYSINHQEYKQIEENLEILVLKLRENHQKHISLLRELTPSNNLETENINQFESDYIKWLRDKDNQNISVEIKWKTDLAIKSLNELREKNNLILKSI